ncbi:UvrD-helicase domain-containing protein [Pseudokineococcus lusitanus]|uniref:RecBCD enzyme subunit RecB n=1 Tax=Pseudokineococcus lusitanus TaxID=763993 RepID=A0A3N1HQN9_9ACTN|nr:UvrD-helicase domain-containing protein [Pseudokineococcus lusitanus]ROP44770.1 exodeoxyribonuclease V beta subunit [Pseudokineococcus lusitanus]
MSDATTTGTPPAEDPGAPLPFRLADPLPRGTTLLEASAGTGKTWTIAALVARYVAEAGLPVDRLLVMTFSRESTRELRERVRARLVEARDVLAHDLGGTAATARPAPEDDPDELLRMLRVGGPDAVALRHRRLADALASFDAATVTTTHGFCQRVLLTLGAGADHDPRTELVEDVRDVVDEVAHDFYLRRWGVPGADEPALTPEAFRDLAVVAASDPATELLPREDEADVPALPALRARVGRAVRAEVQRRLRAAGQMGYDDLLLRLAQVLEDPDGGPRARARLRAQHRVVLVDEFQDTDPVQWRVLRAAFHDADSAAAPETGVARALVLVGDPKQAVYGFRGADVRAYLEARDAAGDLRTLATNQRSDEPVLRGLDAVLAGAALGDARIRVRPLAARLVGRRLHGVPPVRLRVVPRDALPLTRDGLARVPGMRQRVVADVAAQVVELVGGEVTTTMPERRRRADHPSSAPDGPPPPTEVGQRPLAPGDVAVLVRTNAQAQMVREALERVRVPVVVGGRTSVFTTPAAHDWAVLLEALEQPQRGARVRLLALGAFGGHDAASLDAGGDALVDDLGLRVRAWARLLDGRGVGALLEAVQRPRPDRPAGLAERLLGQVGGERRLTDLRHVGQVLHETAVRDGLGVSALLAWLREQVEEAGRDGVVERSRRLESDAAAVQVLTVHSSKGLEFPAVLVPFAWDMWQNSKPSTALVHDADGRRCRDVGGVGGPRWAEHVREHHRAESDEELRLAYVALTRAAGHLTAWWAGTTNTGRGPLHRLLLHRPPGTSAVLPGAPGDDGVPPTVVPVPSDDDVLAALGARAAAGDGSLVVERVAGPPARTPWVPPERATAGLSAATWRRDLDTSWRRTSYSALTAAAHDAGPAGPVPTGSTALGEPEGAVEDDERLPAGPGTPGTGAPGDEVPAVPSAWDALAGSARFGVLVHAVLEELDPSTLPPADGTGPDRALRDLVAEHTAAQGLVLDVDVLTSGLDLALRTPLGPLAGGRCLVDVPARDRLPELDFELPLAGGDDPGTAAGRPTLAGLVPLWRRHCPDGPLAGYADALADLTAGGPGGHGTGGDGTDLRGYLTGSVDAVLRLPVEDGDGERYVVVDYKTNRLGTPEQPLTARDYRPTAMEDAMVAAHYPLQALLYQVALHRFLRWRLPGYDPGRHLGGALYLFVRGMVGPDVTPAADGTVPGVMAWATPPALVVAASDHLAGRSGGTP